MEEKNYGEFIGDIREKLASHSRASVAVFSLVCFVAFIIAVSILVCIILLFFPVSIIEIEGDSRYSYSEIIEVSGVEEGNRLYFIDVERAEKKVLDSCPYLAEANVEICFPNRVIINIREHDNVFAVEHRNGIAYLDPRFRVIEIASDKPDYQYFNATFIKLSYIAENALGENLDGEEIDRANSIVAVLEKYSFLSEINIINVADKYSGYVVADEKIKMIFGSMADIEEKMEYCREVVLLETIPDGMALLFTSIDGSSAFVRTVDEKIIRDEFDFCKK